MAEEERWAATEQGLPPEQDSPVEDAVCEGRLGCSNCMTVAGPNWRPATHLACDGGGGSYGWGRRSDDAAPFAGVLDGSVSPGGPV